MVIPSKVGFDGSSVETNGLTVPAVSMMTRTMWPLCGPRIPNKILDPW